MASTLSNIIPNVIIFRRNYYNPLFSRTVGLIRYFSSKDEKGSNFPKGLNPLKDDKVSEKTDKVKPTSTDDSVHFTKNTSTKESRDAAKKKLFDLLSDIKVSSDTPSHRPSNLQLARPLKRVSKKERFAEFKITERNPEEEMKSAIKAVASNLEDPVKIESELSEQWQSINMPEKEASIMMNEMQQAAEIPDSPVDGELSKTLMSSVEEVASSITGSPEPIKSELTKRLLRLSVDDPSSREKQISMTELLHGLKIEEKAGRPKVASQADQHKDLRSSFEKYSRPPPSQSKIDLFGSPPLNIFNVNQTGKPNEMKNVLWETLQDKELKLLVQFAPSNAFEEMILWTEQGKHWKFPIDNEIEMGAEENVGFHEHVFLDHHLEGFPIRGPVRVFMELVVVGLSKNPYISVERKVENIEWFRQYFKEKEELLRECGALD